MKALVITIIQEVDEFHSKWYKEALIFIETINIPETMPRVVGTQIHRSDTPAESVSDYQKRRITVPLLDHLMCELDYRSDISKTQAIYKINSNSSPTREKSLERKVFISWNFYWRSSVKWIIIRK